MAGFRIGRGRDNRTPQARPQQPRQQPYGQQAPQGQQQPYGYPPVPPNPQQHGGGGPQYGGSPQYGNGPQYGGGGGGGGGQWPQPAGGHGGHGGAHGEPEYFGGPDGQGHGHGQGPGQGGFDPYAANNPGSTQAFSIGEDPYNQGDTYRAGQAAAPPVGPRLHWKDLLRGVVLNPGPTFLQMRDYAMWAPAVIVTFLYGMLAIFGFDAARKDAINATISTAVPYVLTTGVAITISTFILGVVTHSLARQLGGDGAWQPTVGLSMLIMSLTDAPRVIVAMFFGGGETFVQLLGWATWIAAGALLTTMVSKSHDLPWPRALGAASIQLLAILAIIKLGTF